MNGTLKTVISCVSSSVLMLIGGVLLSNYAHRGSLTSFPAYLLKEYNNWIAGNLSEADAAAAKTAADAAAAVTQAETDVNTTADTMERLRADAAVKTKAEADAAKKAADAAKKEADAAAKAAAAARKAGDIRVALDGLDGAVNSQKANS